MTRLGAWWRRFRNPLPVNVRPVYDIPPEDDPGIGGVPHDEPGVFGVNRLLTTLPCPQCSGPRVKLRGTGLLDSYYECVDCGWTDR